MGSIRLAWVIMRVSEFVCVAADGVSERINKRWSEELELE